MIRRRGRQTEEGVDIFLHRGLETKLGNCVVCPVGERQGLRRIPARSAEIDVVVSDEQRPDDDREHGRGMNEQLGSIRPAGRHLQGNAINERPGEVAKIPARERARQARTVEAVFAVEASDVDQHLTIGTAKHKPRIAFIGDAPVRLHRETCLRERMLDAIKFGNLLRRPVGGALTRTEEGENLRSQSRISSRFIVRRVRCSAVKRPLAALQPRPWCRRTRCRA